MALDVYRPCLCGSGKKTKFCCCSDILSDLERVERMAEGDQRVAALDAIDKVLAKYPNRAALLSLKGELLLEMEQFEDAAKSVDLCLEHAPQSGTALAIKAILVALGHSGAEAIPYLQKALELVGDGIPQLVYNAIGVVAQRLAMDGELFAARAHLMIHASIAGDADPEPFRRFLQLNADPQVPLLFKTEALLSQCDANAPSKAEFDRAREAGERGLWQQALAQFQLLAARTPRDGAILKNIAQLAGYLCQSKLAADALRRFAAIESIPLDDRVEAEALAQRFLANELEGELEALLLVQEIDDAEKVQELLLSDRRFQSRPLPEQPSGENEPPPKSVFLMLDRPALASHEGLALADVPRVLTQVMLFGRQTDRAARVEVACVRDDSLALIRQILASLIGEHAQGEAAEEALPRVSVDHVLAVQLRAPDHTPEEVRIGWSRELSREMYLNKWPKLARAELHGKTPQEAARDPAHPTAVLATLLNLELDAGPRALGFDFNELRRKLGLPTCDPIDASKMDPLRIPPARLGRLRVERLSDEVLGVVIRRLALYHISDALKRAIDEVKRRPQLAPQVALPRYYATLASTGGSSAEAIEYLRCAKEEAIARRESPAEYMLQELPWRAMRGEVEQLQNLIRTLQSQHMNEPGIAEGLFNIMARLGLIPPDQLRAMGARLAQAGAQMGAPGAVRAAPPAQAASGLWTPDSPAPAGAAAGPGPAPAAERSKLWLPGSE